METKVCTIF